MFWWLYTFADREFLNLLLYLCLGWEHHELNAALWECYIGPNGWPGRSTTHKLPHRHSKTRLILPNTGHWTFQGPHKRWLGFINKLCSYQKQSMYVQQSPAQNEKKKKKKTALTFHRMEIICLERWMKQKTETECLLLQISVFHIFIKDSGK